MASRTIRAPMPRAKRAKIFQPFDALVGLREAIAAKERITEPRRELTEDSIAEINKTLLALKKGQIITVVYYGDYEQNYIQLTGSIARIDPDFCILQIGSNVLHFPEVYKLEIA